MKKRAIKPRIYFESSDVRLCKKKYSKSLGKLCPVKSRWSHRHCHFDLVSGFFPQDLLIVPWLRYAPGQQSRDLLLHVRPAYLITVDCKKNKRFLFIKTVQVLFFWMKYFQSVFNMNGLLKDSMTQYIGKTKCTPSLLGLIRSACNK